MVNRDSLVLWLGLGVALVGYLTTADRPPTAWAYNDWLQFASFVLAWAMGKLATSPLPGQNDSQTVKRPGGNMGAWLLPLLLVGGVAVSGCSVVGGKPPVITPDDQAQVRAAVTKALAGIEVAGIVARDARQMTEELAAAGAVSASVLASVNQAVITANGVVQQVITELSEATRQVTVDDLARRVVAAIHALADHFEAQGDSRLHTAGRFLRAAVAAVAAMVGVQ